MTITAEFLAKAEAAQNKPVEIIDLFLGSQIADDVNTKHYAMYDKDIEFFDTDGNPQTYEATMIERSDIPENMEMQQDTVTFGIDNVSEEFQAKFWQDREHFLDRRVAHRQLFADLLTAAVHSKVMFDGTIDRVSLPEGKVEVVVESFDGYIGFSSGVPLDRICPISEFADSRCGQSVSPITLLTQETADNVDAGSTTTAIKVKTLAQADGYWKPGKIEFTSGANDGMTRKIIAWSLSGKSLTLDFPLPVAPAEDDTVTVKRDCAHTLKMCTERFTEVNATLGNNANFRGYNTVPTIVNP